MAQHAEKQKKREGRPRNETRSYGLVRAVPSGDTLQILELAESRSASGPLKEIQLTLLGLKAPTFGRKTVKDGKVQVEKDQDWAFESREFLRKLVIGKCVVYRVEHEVADSIVADRYRHYGEVWLGDENLRFKIVRAGWAEPIERTNPRKGRDGNDAAPSEDYQELLSLRENAESAGIGKFQKEVKKARHTNYRAAVRGREDELFAFFEKNRDKPLTGIVEQVRSGSTIRVLLTKTMDSIPLLLSGIKCPTFEFGDDASCEPFSREAKFITEHYLLHRDVHVTLEGFDSFSNYVGSVVDHEGRNVSLTLLQMGLANFVEWTVPKNPAGAAKQFREAERQAQESKLRLWNEKENIASPKGKKKDPSSPIKSNHSDSIVGRVVEIVNAGTISVRVTKDGKGGHEDKKINFSSIIVPRLLTNFPKKKDLPSDSQKLKEEELENKWQSAFAAEAKEYLRSKIIGEEVKCEFDYVRATKDSKDQPKQFWTVSYKGQNLAVELASRGWAKVVRHSTDEARARGYQDLLIAEKGAQKSGKGWFSSTKTLPSSAHKTDLTERDEEVESDPVEGEDGATAEKKIPKKTSNAARAQQFLNALKRAGKMQAVVEHVFSGSRFKLYVPSQSVIIFFSLLGISVPKPSNENPEETKISDAALAFSKDRVHQRNVEITIFNVDKGGNFLGQLIFNKIDLGLKLIEEGFARVQSRSLERLLFKNDYLGAQDKAQKSKLRLWVSWDEKAEKEKQAIREQERKARDAEQKAPDRFQIAVTEIINGANFCYQVIGEETKALSDMMNLFQSTAWEEKEQYSPKAPGEIVSAKFSQDNHWYRAEVTKVNDDSTCQLTYIDYGNSETVSTKNIRKLLSEFNEKIVPRQAKVGRLAYIVPPKLTDEYGKEAAAFFKDLVWGKTLDATIYTDYNGNASLVVGDPQASITINGALVAEGLARTEKRRTGNQYFQALKQEEEKARRDHLNMWQFGDIPDSDDERDL